MEEDHEEYYTASEDEFFSADEDDEECHMLKNNSVYDWTIIEDFWLFISEDGTPWLLPLYMNSSSVTSAF